MWTEALTRPADASTAPYLTRLNDAQREAVQFGVGAASAAAVDLAGRMRAMWR